MTGEPADGERRIAVVLAEAAAAAGYAPSVHNTQPWRWQVHPDRLELRADRQRQLTVADPQGRLLLVSCGTALHHCRLALAAEGWAAVVDRLPDPADRDLLARIAVTERHGVEPAAIRLVQAMQIRHSDRRPVSDQALGHEAVEQIRAAVRAEGVQLEVLTGAQVYELAAAAARAEAVEADDERLRAELAYWSRQQGPAGTGLPGEVLPENAPRTTVPGRDFAATGTLPVGPGHDSAAVYGLLYGDEDEPESWLRAGEALSAAWLTATELGASLLPMSGAIEVDTTREALRRLLSGLGWPYLVVRLGVADPDHAGPPHTPRLPTDQVVDTSAVRTFEG